MKGSKIVLLAVLGFSLIGQVACLEQKTPSEKNFEAQLNVFLSGEQEDINVASLTDFNWNNLCVFKAADSAPKSGYLHYEDHISKQKLTLAKIKPTSDYIFLFCDQDQKCQHIVLGAPIQLHKDKHYLTFAENVIETGQCFDKSVKIQKKSGFYLLVR